MKKENEGNVTFGNDNSAKIMGKGTVNLGRKYALAKNVLLIENMKHNILIGRKYALEKNVLLIENMKHNLLSVR